MSNVELAEKLNQIGTRYGSLMGSEEREAGIHQMILDLGTLAKQDGCVAAAWAIEMIRQYVDHRDHIVRLLQKANRRVEKLEQIIESVAGEFPTAIDINHRNVMVSIGEIETIFRDYETEKRERAEMSAPDDVVARIPFKGR